MNKPIKDSYWVLEGKLLAGEYPRTFDETGSYAKLSSFIKYGINCFIDLTEVNSLLKPYKGIIEEFDKEDNIIVRKFPIIDMSIPESPDFTKMILDFIDEQIESGKIVYVHCWGGIGRTGTIIGCWLSRHGYKEVKALEKLKELWSDCDKSFKWDSPQTVDQINYVLRWKE